MTPLPPIAEFYDEAAAYRFVETVLWPHYARCPQCGSDEAGKLRGKSTRIGVYKCYRCRKPFTVKIGTPLENSHLKMHIWLRAIYLQYHRKDKPTSTELRTALGVTHKTALRIKSILENTNELAILSPPRLP